MTELMTRQATSKFCFSLPIILGPQKGEDKITTGVIFGYEGKGSKGPVSSHPLCLFTGNRAWIELPGAQQVSGLQLHEA